MFFSFFFSERDDMRSVSKARQKKTLSMDYTADSATPGYGRAVVL
jgi:hypothetical protein